MKPRVEFKPRAPHHLYIGLIIILFGWLMAGAYWPKWTVDLFYTSGFIIALDDLIEHTITGSTLLRWFFINVMLKILTGDRNGKHGNS